jgi:hypothetical protein
LLQIKAIIPFFKWMLTEGGALITNVILLDGEGFDSNTVWDRILMSSDPPFEDSGELSSLLNVMVLLDDAPADFVAVMSPQNAEIVTQGREIRALRPSYLEQQHALISSTIITCCFPSSRRL